MEIPRTQWKIIRALFKIYFVFKFLMRGSKFSLAQLGTILDVPFTTIMISNLLLSSLCILLRVKVLSQNLKWLQMNLNRELLLPKSASGDIFVFKSFFKLYTYLVDCIEEINSVFTVGVKST